jgi:hypothetical protein
MCRTQEQCHTIACTRCRRSSTRVPRLRWRWCISDLLRIKRDILRNDGQRTAAEACYKRQSPKGAGDSGEGRNRHRLSGQWRLASRQLVHGQCGRFAYPSGHPLTAVPLSHNSRSCRCRRSVCGTGSPTRRQRAEAQRAQAGIGFQQVSPSVRFAGFRPSSCNRAHGKTSLQGIWFGQIR